MPIEKVQGYKTSDGAVFDDRTKANEHEARLGLDALLKTICGDSRGAYWSEYRMISNAKAICDILSPLANDPGQAVVKQAGATPNE